MPDHIGDTNMARLILGVTGSVAAIKTPELLAALVRAGHEVRVVATEAGALLRPARRARAAARDGCSTGVRSSATRTNGPPPGYRRGDPVLHIELRKWADLLVVAPLDANTLAKFALGISDNFLTCVFRAWDFARPVFLAPAMNTLMWQSPVTLPPPPPVARRPRRWPRPGRLDAGQAADVFARYAPRIVLIPPAGEPPGVRRRRHRRDGRGARDRRDRPRVVRPGLTVAGRPRR